MLSETDVLSWIEQYSQDSAYQALHWEGTIAVEDAGAIVLRTDQVGTIDVALGRRRHRGADRAPGAGRGDRASSGSRGRTSECGPGRPAGLPYDRRDARPVARGRRRPPPLARPARVASPPRARRRRDRRLARGALRGPRRRRRSGARRSGRAPPRRRQGGPPDGPGGRPAPRRRLRRLARRARDGRARAGGRGSPRDAPPRSPGPTPGWRPRRSRSSSSRMPTSGPASAWSRWTRASPSWRRRYPDGWSADDGARARTRAGVLEAAGL